jgi:hypothetical protein
MYRKMAAFIGIVTEMITGEEEIKLGNFNFKYEQNLLINQWQLCSFTVL